MRKKGIRFTAALLMCISMTAYAQESQAEQRKVSVVVVSITGNELTYYEVQEEKADSEEMSETDTEISSEEITGTSSEEAETKSREAESDESLNEISANNTKMSGELPEGFDPDDFAPEQGKTGEAPEGFLTGGVGQSDMKTVYIPVSVPVHTNTDETMRFSILEEGDELEVLFEEKDGEEVITEIWLIRTSDTKE